MGSGQRMRRKYLGGLFFCLLLFSNEQVSSKFSQDCLRTVPACSNFFLSYYYRWQLHLTTPIHCIDEMTECYKKNNKMNNRLAYLTQYIIVVISMQAGNLQMNTRSLMDNSHKRFLDRWRKTWDVTVQEFEMCNNNCLIITETIYLSYFSIHISISIPIRLMT